MTETGVHHASGVDVDEALELYRSMARIRRFEERSGELFAAGEIPGFIHLGIGQESVAAGVCGALRPTDWVTATHRGHGHILAKGGAMGPMMAELMGKDNGACRGKGGSMHIFSVSIGALGANGILGAGQPIAVGAALSSRLRGRDDVVATFFGEGASAQGAVHEAMNLAAVWALPVVFVAEVNGYAELTPYPIHVSVPSLASRGSAYGMPSASVDGGDARAVRVAAREAVDAARAGRGPQLLEVRTHRWRGHFEGDAQRYRPADDVDVAAVDPVARLRTDLHADGLADALDAIDRDVEDEVADAVEFGRAGALPHPEDALRHVYAMPMGTAGGGR